MRTCHLPSARVLFLGWLAALILAGCGATVPPPTSPVPSPAPSVGPPGGTGGGSSGGSGGSGIGIGIPVVPGPVGPGPGQPTLVVPRPGQLNPHPMSPEKLEASVDGRHVLVKVIWTSGVEPCNVLDSVQVDREGRTFAITVLEGSGDPNAVCIEIAQQKATIVDLGELDPGLISIVAPNGNAAPLNIQIV